MQNVLVTFKHPSCNELIFAKGVLTEYKNEYLTDGIIPNLVLSQLCSNEEINIPLHHIVTIEQL